jgi:hypothetical protein
MKMKRYDLLGKFKNKCTTPGCVRPATMINKS